MMEFRQLNPLQLNQLTDSIDEATCETAKRIVEDVRKHGEASVRQYAEQFDALSAETPLVIPAAELVNSLDRVDDKTVGLFRRTRNRIEMFAAAQRATIADLDIPIAGGRAGHRWFPLQSAGCYSPGGRYPLPSSVLMTAVTARVAGVEQVIVATPKPNDMMLAAAAIAGADAVLQVGGAQAIAALAFGLENTIPACDVIVGPGNRYVTAAKSIVSRFTRIDMLAGPSELVVATAGDANPALVAADLLAQAEHDPDARPILITTDDEFPRAVAHELNRQLESLSTADIASVALAGGGYLIAADMTEVLRWCQQLSPEHLSLQGKQFEAAAEKFRMGSALFVGSQTAEVFGDYGAGPNHVLPTGRSARSRSALSIIDFMRFQTFLQLHSAQPELIDDATELGRLEGLQAHARSASMR